MKDYPRIGRIDRHNKNICAKCRCGELGTAKVHVEYTYMRGEDEVVWACEKHKKDLEFLRDSVAESLGTILE